MRKLIIALAAIGVLGAGGSASAAPNPPQNTSPPTISGTAQQSQTLTADPGTWSGTQPITFTYQWRRCNQNGRGCSNIAGATDKTRVATRVDVGNTLRVVVKATNTDGSTNAISAPTSTVAPPESISLDATRSMVVYGRTTTLVGSVDNGKAGQTVTITQRRLPPTGDIKPQALTTVKVRSDGTFRFTVRPSIRTLFRATDDQTKSNLVSVRVRPLLRLRAIAPHRFLLRAIAARSYVGKFASLQRWNRFRHRWVSVRAVFFQSSTPGASPTVTSRVVFRTRVHGRIRLAMSRRQVGAGYNDGFSNAFRI
jgi:hypothetical protein